GADAGLAVTLAGKPERWAVGVRGGRRLTPRWKIDLGLFGVAFADGQGGALVPKVAARAGPWRWITLEASVELVANLRISEPMRWIGGLGLEIVPRLNRP